MKVDLYTKAVLTVIAVALIALVVRDYTMPAHATLDAKQASDRVTITNKQPWKVRIVGVPQVVVKNVPLAVVSK